MKEKTPSMAHQSNDQNQIPPQQQPLELKKPHQPKDHTKQEQQKKDDSDNKDETHRQTPSASKTHLCNKLEIALQELVLPPVKEGINSVGAEGSGRERLKRHRVEVAGRVWIPEIWGQEELLKDWIDCTAFDAPFVPSRIVTAREALVQEATRATTGVEFYFL